jgi:hypothetical protein
MAITAISNPPQLNLAYRPMVYKWSSNASDLQYCIIEILNDGTRIAAKSIQLDLGSSTNFTVNINDIIQDNIGFELNTLGSTGVITPTNNSGRMENISVKVYEVVLTGGVLVTAYNPDNANNSNFDFNFSGGLASINAYNWTISHFDYNSLNISDYQLTSTNRKFLNNAPLIKDIELGVSEYLGLLNGFNAPATFDFKLEILTYNSSNALLSTDYINVTDWNINNSSNNLEHTYLTIGVGTSNLTALGVSFTNVSYYTVQLKQSTNIASELRRFNISDVCDGDVRIHWANNFGKQDSYTFKGNKIETLNHKSKTYLKAIGNTYSSEKRGTTVMQNISNSSFEIFTESINKNDYDFLASMLINKNAFIEDSGSYYPIIIEDGSKLIRNELNVPIQFKLVYRFANDTKGLRG